LARAERQRRIQEKAERQAALAASAAKEAEKK